MAGNSHSNHSHSNNGSGGGSPAGRLAREVSSLQAALLHRLRDELPGVDTGDFAATAQDLAEKFGAVAAVVVDAAHAWAKSAQTEPESKHSALSSLYRPGHMRRRLDQMVETNKRYGHPFALVVFDASGPGTRNGKAGRGQESVLSTVGAALRNSVRFVDEAFWLEEDAICVLAPNLGTVEAVQMAERLLSLLEELERAGGLRVSISVGVVSCPDHGTDADELLKKADAAMWRARAVGQPVGVGELCALQDR